MFGLININNKSSLLKTKTYDHIIKRINKCTGLSKDDCCVKQTKTRPSPLKNKAKQNKTKETRMPILFTKMNKVFLQAT